MRSIGKKINLLFGILLLVISSTIIIYNAVSQQASITRQLTGTELPLRSDSVINSIDKKLLEPARNLDLITKGPLLQNWIKNGEPNSELDTIYQMLGNMVKTYGCLGANFVSQSTRQYTDLIGGERKYDYRVDDKKDPWFSGFRDSGVETNIVVYVDDPVWGTKAFINRRVSVDGKFAGLLSTSIDIQDFAREISSMSIGEKGTLLITDQAGLIRFASDTRNINKNLQEIAPAYREFWSKATAEDGFQITYKDDSGDTRYTIVRKIPVLDYFLCLEASGQEMLGEVQFNIWIGIAISLVLVLLGLIIAFMFVKGIVRPIRQTADFALAVSRGELDRSLEVRGQDETGVLADALRGMVGALKQKIAQAEEQEQRAKEDARRTEEALRNVELQQQKIQVILDGMRHGTEEIGKVSASLSEVARELGHRNDNVARGAEEQYNSLLATSDDVAMMMDKFHEILHGAGSTSESVESARGKALEGEKSVQNVIAANQRVNDAAGQMQQAMQSLESQAEGINRIVSTINDIADQTNLLALNAAIEAARAGDAGRGFAVVADEVRKLAEKTMVATKDVSDAITSVQQSARENMRTMEETYAAVHEATELAGGSGESLRSIVELSEKNAGQVRGIADSVSSLVAYSENITGSLERVNTIARDTQNGMEAAAGELRELISISSSLDKLILKLQETAK